MKKRIYRKKTNTHAFTDAGKHTQPETQKEKKMANKEYLTEKKVLDVKTDPTLS